MSYLAGLNEEQLQVVQNTEGPVLVVAGPGTGKTHLLSVRAAHLIKEKKARPENILVLSFTNAAAKAMKERLAAILGRDGYDVETATFHSFANSVILESEEAANYIQEKIQISELEKVKVLEYILDHTDGIDTIRPFRAPYRYRSEIEARLSELKKEGISPSEFKQSVDRLKEGGAPVDEKHLAKLRALSLVYTLYEEYKQGKNPELFDERGRYDFDDMIMYALCALREEKELQRALRQQYPYIMVDEYQDTNGAQLKFLFELVDPSRPNLCCVGDDDQSIFRFQGASVMNFKILRDKFGQLRTVTLKDNYRSTGVIIDLSRKIIGHLPEVERMGHKELSPRKKIPRTAIEFRQFTTEAEELLFITRKVSELKALIEQSATADPQDRKHPYNAIAVLVRKRGDILKIIDAFLQAGIPYATDGKEDISSEKRVRQMTDVLRLAHQKDTTDLADKDAIFYRVITSDYFGIPLTDVLRLIQQLRSRKRRLREKGEGAEITLFFEFLTLFAIKDLSHPPSRSETSALASTKEIAYENPRALHHASWVIRRLLDGAQTRLVHDILLGYIEDAGVFRYILDAYAKDGVLKIRDLRALSSLVNMVKESDINNPALTLADFIDELDTRQEHGVPLAGNLVTMTQEGVRIFTAHGSKGLEFHSVIIPFCLQNRNWPLKARPDLIPLPAEILATRQKASGKDRLRELNFFDETRLFYVASTRARSTLIYTASPTESNIRSSYLTDLELQDALPPAQEAKEDELLVESLRRTDTPDPFTAAGSILRDMVSNMTLNPTSLNNYIICKRKFLYDNVLMLPAEKKLSLTFGNCVHKALEDSYREYLRNNSFPDFAFFKRSFERELNYQGVNRSIRSGCLRQLQTIKAWFERESRSPLRPLGLEKKLAVMLDKGLIFTGKYDKTEPLDEKVKLVRVVDYKTGPPDDHLKHLDAKGCDLSSDECENYLRQLVAYKLLFDRDKDQNQGLRVGEGMLVFVEPVKASSGKYGLKQGEYIKKSVVIGEEMVLELEKVIRDVWKNIQRLQFDALPQRDGVKCRNCDFDVMCWAR